MVAVGMQQPEHLVERSDMARDGARPAATPHRAQLAEPDKELEPARRDRGLARDQEVPAIDAGIRSVPEKAFIGLASAVLPNRSPEASGGSHMSRSLILGGLEIPGAGILMLRLSGRHSNLSKNNPRAVSDGASPSARRDGAATRR